MEISAPAVNEPEPMTGCSKDPDSPGEPAPNRPSCSKDSVTDTPNTTRNQKAQLYSPITESFKKGTAYSVGGTRHSKIVQCLLYFICKDNRPFSVIEGSGFKKLLHELALPSKFPLCTTLKTNYN